LDISLKETTMNIRAILMSGLLLAAPAMQAKAKPVPTGPPLTQRDLDSSLEAARTAWAVEVTSPIEVRLDPLNACVIYGGGVPPRTAIIEVHDFHEFLIFDDGSRADAGTTYRYVIKVNSNCNWSDPSLSLQLTMLHELGHILIGAAYHSANPKSLMYPVVKPGQQILPDDLARIERTQK
jgi:hypothetical protein